MKKIRYIAIISALACIVCALASCQKTEYKSTELYARVSSLSADRASFIVGELEGIELPDGEMPAMPDGEMPAIPDGAMPAMPDGNGFGGKDQANKGGADLSSYFKEGKEVIEIELSAQTLSTLTINAIVKISFDAEGRATVTRLDGFGGGRQPMGDGTIPQGGAEGGFEDGTISGEMGTMSPSEQDGEN